MEMRLRVDPVACDGFGHCAELAPEFIALDEWGYPIIQLDVIPRELERVAEMAVNQCPRKALILEKVDRNPPASRRRGGTKR
jgi:ferredoxin